jgi:hypothetical protein
VCLSILGADSTVPRLAEKKKDDCQVSEHNLKVLPRYCHLVATLPNMGLVDHWPLALALSRLPILAALFLSLDRFDYNMTNLLPVQNPSFSLAKNLTFFEQIRVCKRVSKAS